MPPDQNQHPEQKARDQIDLMLQKAGWVVQSKSQVNLSAALGVALCEANTVSESADFCCLWTIVGDKTNLDIF